MCVPNLHMEWTQKNLPTYSHTIHGLIS
jgi:hypothetical protein